MGKTFEGIERPAPEAEAVEQAPPPKTEAEALADVQSALADLAKAKQK